MNNNIKLNVTLFCLFTFSLIMIACEKEEEFEKARKLNNKTTAIFNPELTYGTLEDIDGNIYKTIEIGTQTWMAENLRTTTLNDGLYIPHCTNDNLWPYLGSEAYCNYNNTTNLDTIATYGHLYNWFAVNTGRLAPDGWHVATLEDWETLINYLGEDVILKIKETDTLHWKLQYKETSNNATNESGFTAVPAGFRYTGNTFDYSTFHNLGNYCGFWTDSTYNDENAFGMFLYYYLVGGGDTNNYQYFLKSSEMKKHYGISIRCVKD